MAIGKMSLESVYYKNLASYLEQGHTEHSWQWRDEGRVYAIQDYISSCGEMTDADWHFAKVKGITKECEYELKEEEK